MRLNAKNKTTCVAPHAQAQGSRWLKVALARCARSPRWCIRASLFVASSSLFFCVARGMSEEAKRSGVQTRSGATNVSKKLFGKSDKDKEKSKVVVKLYTREELTNLGRVELRDLARRLKVPQSGSDSDLADRLGDKFEELKGQKGDGDATDGIMETDTDTYGAFAFEGFANGVTPTEAVEVVQGFIRDYFEDFAVTIAGVCESRGQVCLTFPAVQEGPLSSKVFMLRDAFVHKDVTLNAVEVDMLEIDRFKPPEASAPSGQASSSQQGLLAGGPLASHVPVAPLGGTRGASGSVAPLSWPIPPGVATFNVATPASVPLAQLSPQIVEAKQRLQSMRAALAEVPPLPTGGEGSQPTNADLMAKLDRMMGAMALKEDVQVAQLEVVKQLRTEFRSEVDPLRAQAAQTEANVNKALDETKTLNNRLLVVEQTGSSAVVDARLKKLESQVAAMQRQNNRNDPAHKRLAFIGFSSGAGSETRKAAMDAFLKQYAPSQTAKTYGDFTSWSSETNARVISRVSYAEFEDAKAVESALKSIKSKLPKCDKDAVKLTGSEHAKVRHAKTQQNIDRDTALRKAEELIKSSPAATGKTVERKGGAERTVVVNGETVFLQDKKGVSGTFYAPFEALTIP